MPNLMPFIAASFVGAVAGAMLEAIGLEALGLGAIQTQTLGITIYWSQEYTAVLRGMWWWWAPPVVVISLIFLALFLTSAGMDRFANPRLRRS
jgi:peptide/nickel transport system permease protein